MEVPLFVFLRPVDDWIVDLLDTAEMTLKVNFFSSPSIFLQPDQFLSH